MFDFERSERAFELRIQALELLRQAVNLQWDMRACSQKLYTARIGVSDPAGVDRLRGEIFALQTERDALRSEAYWLMAQARKLLE